MVRVRLGKGLRRVDDLGLYELVYRELFPYIGRDEADLNEVKRLVEKVNEGLRGKGLRIEIRKAPPSDKKADYYLMRVRIDRSSD